MSQVKLDAAAELIREGKYSEARAILKTIDDPKARDWLARIDQMSGGSLQAKQEQAFTTLEYVIGQFVGKGWTITSETDMGASLEKKASSNGLAILLGIPAILILIFYDIVIGLICVGAALLLVAINNATKKAGSVRIRLMSDGRVSVNANQGKYNADYPLGFTGRVKA